MRCPRHITPRGTQTGRSSALQTVTTTAARHVVVQSTAVTDGGSTGVPQAALTTWTEAASGQPILRYMTFRLAACW